jgi:glycosyltransferase involved in cell wall biosynthesis
LNIFQSTALSPENIPMHIGINGLCFLPRQVGPCTYVRNLVTELGKLQTNHRFTVYLPASAKPFFPPAPTIRYRFLPTGNLIVRIVLEQIVLPLLVRRARCELLHSLSNVVPLLLGSRNVLTVHDIYQVHDPKRFTFWKRTYLQVMVPRSVRAARLIVAVSHTTRNDLIHFYKASPERIVVTHEGYKTLISDNDAGIERVRQRYGITDPYFLFVGTLEPGKNLHSLITAFKPLANEMQLVIAGKWWVRFKELFDLVQNLSLTKRVLFPGYVPDTDLGALYKNAAAFVLPSFHEGFGLPLVEAMAAGCPVCCSNTSCMPEIVGDSAITFDPRDIRQIEAALAAVRHPDRRADLVTRGLARVKRFTWQACACKTMLVYDALAAGQPMPALLTEESPGDAAV